MQRSKAETYLGFAKRAGKLTLGVNAAQAVKKDVFLLVADSGVAKNSRKEIVKLQKKFSCPLVSADDLETLVGKANCKLAAVRDQSLASALCGEIGKGVVKEFCTTETETDGAEPTEGK